MSEILVPVSFGELLDKIAILQIKSERMSDEAKLANVRNELSALERTWMAHPAAGHNIAELRAALKATTQASSRAESRPHSNQRVLARWSRGAARSWSVSKWPQRLPCCTGCPSELVSGCRSVVRTRVGISRR